MRHSVMRRLTGGVWLVFVALGTAVAGAADGGVQRHTASRDFAQTIPVTKGQSLRLDHSHGDIRIRAHAASEVQIRAAIKVSADALEAAEAVISHVRIDVEETSASVAIRTRYPDQRDRTNVSFSVDYTILMPETMPLTVQNSFGNVRVESLKAGTTLVNAHGRVAVTDGAGRHRIENAFGRTEARRIAGDLAVTSGNGDVRTEDVQGALTIDNRFGRVHAARVAGAAKVTNTNGAVELTHAASASVQNAFGSVKVTAITGDATISNGNGPVDAQAIAGNADLKTSFSTLRFLDIGQRLTVTGANMSVTGRQVRGAASITTTFGAVDVREVESGIKVFSGNGDVRLMDVAGPVYVKTTFSAVRVERVRGGLTVDNANGGVQATDVAGSADITTSFGGVVLKEVAGDVDIKNRNGAIEVALSRQSPPCHDLTLATSFSPIRLHLPEHASYALDARVTFGKINSDLPVAASGALATGALKGTIGKGECALRATTTNGDIQIRALAAGQ